MKIAFFTNGFPMMSEPFIALAAASLIDRGHAVDIYGLSSIEPTGFSSAASIQRKLRGRFRNASWPAGYGRRLAQLPAVSWRLARRRGLGKLPVLKPQIYRRGWVDLTSSYQAEAFTLPGSYDILHCHFATLGEFVLKHRRAGILKGRLIVHFRGYDISEVVRTQGPDVYDYLWGAAEGFVANCAHFRDRAIGLGCPADKIAVVGSGIDLAGFPYRDPRPLSGGAVECITVGRLTPRKGVHVLIEALRRLTERGRDLNLTVVGDGEQRPALEKQVGDAGLAERVRFLGACDHAQIRALLDASHLFVAASMTSPTGGADAPVNTIKEAMAVGVPTCATRHGGIPELVQEGETGVLAEEGDPADLAAALDRLLLGEADWPALTRRARARVERTYGNDAVTDKLLEVYRRALSSGPHGSSKAARPEELTMAPSSSFGAEP
ncbi:MAG TPA: colanic acid biosynthesis glycosyltransferase WcaL [Kiloniellaceae bacterium]|nr:colanic acid biosynthesis glycosyltransferase WcaL [Kiloniellaceae bacterium]